jgi:UDP-N-acetylmuramate dehydrogenase
MKGNCETISMISEGGRRTLMKLTKGDVLFDEPMKNHTSFRIGGPVEALVIPKSENDLRKLLSFHRKNSIPLTVIGKGTKLLVSDEGIDGIIVKISGCFSKVSISGTKARVGGGRSLANLSRLVADHGLSGLEFAVGIPGTVGGGVAMNAGAHGAMMKDVVTNVVAMNREGEIREYSKDDLDFRYRESKLLYSNVIVLSVQMNFVRNDVERILRTMHEYIQWRKKTQPLDLPNAGSVFKNPTGSSAAKLIDMAGLKGIRAGGARISEKHANFIANEGNATARDVRCLMSKMKKEVFEKFGIMLEPEIRFLGRFD